MTIFQSDKFITLKFLSAKFCDFLVYLFLTAMNSSAYIMTGSTYKHYKGGLYQITAIATGGGLPARATLVGEYKGRPDVNLKLYTWRSHGVDKYRYLGIPGRMHVFYQCLETGANWVRPLMDFIDRVPTVDGTVLRFAQFTNPSF